MTLKTKVLKEFSKDILKFNDVEEEVERISGKLKDDILRILKRKGAVIGVSGGIDSSVTLALIAKAIGSEKILAVMLPEKDSSWKVKNWP